MLCILDVIMVIIKEKLFQSRWTHLLYCRVLSLSGNVNTRRMSKPDMEGKGNYYVNHQNYQIKCFYPPRLLNKHWCIYSCLQTPPSENWFQCVRRVYVTAISFPCIITLVLPVCSKNNLLSEMDLQNCNVSCSLNSLKLYFESASPISIFNNSWVLLDFFMT